MEENKILTFMEFTDWTIVLSILTLMVLEHYCLSHFGHFILFLSSLGRAPLGVPISYKNGQVRVATILSTTSQCSMVSYACNTFLSTISTLLKRAQYVTHQAKSMNHLPGSNGILGWREAIIIKCLAHHGHKCRDRDSNPHPMTRPAELA